MSHLPMAFQTHSGRAGIQTVIQPSPQGPELLMAMVPCQALPAAIRRACG